MTQKGHLKMATTHDEFSTDTSGLPEARASQVVELGDGDRFDLTIAPVANRIGDTAVRMLAYDGSIPGPTLKVREGSEIVVDIENQGDVEATVHWHGLRLENRYDGTHETQQPMAAGGRYTAHVSFPTPASTGITHTSARTTARKWGCTATFSWSPRSRIIGPRFIASSRSRSMTC
jgi:FtsP/CotA-like multicopper oxidase with cupredoxin domain